MSGFKYNLHFWLLMHSGRDHSVCLRPSLKFALASLFMYPYKIVLVRKNLAADNV